MPVTVQCFHCNAVLDLDDGFRGGVCRCSNCGSLLQVPRGDDAPTARKVRPATPPSPTSPTTPLQNATSSKLDVGISRGQFDSPPSPQIRRHDLGMSSGLAGARIHPTTPIAAPVKTKRRRPSSAPQDPQPTAPSPPSSPAPTTAAPRNRTVFWLVILLIALTLTVFASLIIYYLYFYEPSLLPT